MIKAIDLCYQIKERVLFDHLSFELPNQGLVLIDGENGSGKTTLLMILACLLSPTSGSLFYDDVNMNEKSLQKARKRKETAIYLAPNGNLDPHLTVESNLFKYSVKDADKAPFYDRYPDSLSGGETELVMSYLISHTDKKCVFMDEGLLYLDEDNQSETLTSLEKASESKLIVLASPRELALPFTKVIRIGE